MSHHPARRARTVTAVLSAAAFVGIAGGLAAEHAGATATGRAGTSTRGSTTVTDTGDQGGPADNGASTGGGWSATPGQVGQQGQVGQVGQDHGSSGAS